MTVLRSLNTYKPQQEQQPRHLNGVRLRGPELAKRKLDIFKRTPIALLQERLGEPRTSRSKMLGIGGSGDVMNACGLSRMRMRLPRY